VVAVAAFPSASNANMRSMRGEQQRGDRDTRGLVKEGLEAGMTRAAIADWLGVSRPTVTYHARKLGFRTDARFALQYDWSEIRQAYESGLSVRECIGRFGFSTAAWAAAVRRGDVIPRPRERPIEELLVRKWTSRKNLKCRLFGEGLKERECEECGISQWEGQRLELHLHHVNGDGHDNRLENLQVLCPNCHSQTPNYGGRNRRGADGD
jgi:5-methylcytosine-specific restriction endonuclease McrA